jgi:Tol biopolymer transport system component
VVRISFCAACAFPLSIAACGINLRGLEELSGAGIASDAASGAPSIPEASATDDVGVVSTIPDTSDGSDAGNLQGSASEASVSDDATVESSIPDGPSADAPAEGASLAIADAGPPACDPASPLGAPVLVAGIMSTASEGGLRMTPDETTGFFWSTRPGGPGTVNLYVATRASRAASFATIALLSSIDVAGNQYDPSVTADALTLAFGSDRSSSDGTFDLFLATRATAGGDFSGVTPIAGLNTSSDDQQPYLLPDGSEIYFSSNRSGDSDIYRARALSGGGFGAASAVAEINTAGLADEHPVVSADGLTIFFSSTRPGGMGNIDVWTSTRASPDDAFGTPVDVGAVSSSSKDIPDWISPDGCRLYLHSDRNGGSPHEYMATRSP